MILPFGSFNIEMILSETFQNVVVVKKIVVVEKKKSSSSKKKLIKIRTTNKIKSTYIFNPSGANLSLASLCDCTRLYRDPSFFVQNTKSKNTFCFSSSFRNLRYLFRACFAVVSKNVIHCFTEMFLRFFLLRSYFSDFSFCRTTNHTKTSYIRHILQ